MQRVSFCSGFESSRLLQLNIGSRLQALLFGQNCLFRCQDFLYHRFLFALNCWGGFNDFLWRQVEFFLGKSGGSLSLDQVFGSWGLRSDLCFWLDGSLWHLRFYELFGQYRLRFRGHLALGKRFLVLVDAAGVTDDALKAQDALHDLSLSLNIANVDVLGRMLLQVRLDLFI